MMDKEKLLINNPKSNNSEDMSNKQIEEMAEISSQACFGECFKNAEGLIDCDICRAIQFYEAGYRKQSEGEWIDADPDGMLYRFTCSLCGKTRLGKETPFCPHCGAKMKGGAE